MYFILLLTKAPATRRHFFIITAVITGVAGFVYLTMAAGATTSLVGDRSFYRSRYVDWVVTAPLLLLDLALLTLANWRREINLIATPLVGLDVFMIPTGLLVALPHSVVARYQRI